MHENVLSWWEEFGGYFNSANTVLVLFSSWKIILLTNVIIIIIIIWSTSLVHGTVVPIAKFFIGKK